MLTGQAAFFGSYAPHLSAGFLTCGSRIHAAPSHACGTMDFAADLPAYSDRIVQDLHLIPFYPADKARGH